MTDALLDYLDSRRRTPFEWGKHDCACFAAGAIDAVHGTEFVRAVKSYGILSARAYRRMLRSGRRLEDMVREVLGAPDSLYVDERTERGNIVLVGMGASAALAIATAPVLLVAHEVGFRPIPMAAGTRVWRVA